VHGEQDVLAGGLTGGVDRGRGDHGPLRHTDRIGSIASAAVRYIVTAIVRHRPGAPRTSASDAVDRCRDVQR
jgi:hypothetical protein